MACYNYKVITTMKVSNFFSVNIIFSTLFFLVLFSSCESDDNTNDTTFNVQRKIYYVGETIAVEISNPSIYEEKAWVGVFKTTSESTSEELILWEYIAMTDANGILKLTQKKYIKEIGTYEVRVFGDNSYKKELAKDNFTVGDRSIDIRDYGAVCDGVTDDSDAINQALKVAAEEKKAVQFGSGVCLLKKRLLVYNGVTQIFGGKLKFVNPKNYGILLLGKVHKQEENVKDLRIHHMEIEMKNTPYSYAIIGYNVSRVSIDHNKIENKKGVSYIYLIAHKDGMEDAVDNNISYNTITSSSRSRGISIYVSSQLDYVYPPEEYTDPTDGKKKKWAVTTWLWMKDKTYAKPYYNTLRTTISHNDIIGGYYGIGLNGVSESIIEDNKIVNNARNISMQNGSNKNRVANNTLRNSVSASIHLAYGSSDNTIINNDISTSIAVGEGLLQAYVGSKNNLFEGNTVESTGKTGARWMLYFAVHADGNKAINNTFKGTYHRACIAVEPAWDETVTHIAHRGSYLTKRYRHHVWANQDTDGIVIKDNVLDVRSVKLGGNYIAKNQPEIFISQINDKSGVHKVTNLIIENNKILNPNPNYVDPVFFIDDKI